MIKTKIFAVIMAVFLLASSAMGADTKTSQLPAASALTGPELIACTQSSTSKKCTVTQIRGAASNIQNDSTVSGASVKDALDTIDATRSTDITQTHKHQVYIVGDSISATTYGPYLATLLGDPWGIIEKGASGERVSQMVTYYTSSFISPGDADYVIILAGINDIIADTAAATIEANLQTMYSAASAAGQTVVAVTILPWKNYTSWSAGRQTVTDDVNTWILNTATDVDYRINAYAAFEDPGAPDAMLAAYDSGDGLHPNTAGKSFLADTIHSGATWTANPALDNTTFTLSGLNVNINQNLRTSDTPLFAGIRSSASVLPITGATKIIAASSTDILNLVYDSTHYARFGVSNTGKLNIYTVPSGQNIGFGAVGGALVNTSTGTFYGQGLLNGTTALNAALYVSDAGAYITRNINDANPVMYIQQVHASSTGDILQLKNSNSTVFTVAKTGTVTIGKLLVNTPQEVTCTENGSPSTLTITPTSAYIEITNSDAEGCNITMSETGMTVGTVVTLCIVSNAGGTVGFADTAGVTQLNGAFAADIDDCLVLRYGNPTTWREVSRSAN